MNAFKEFGEMLKRLRQYDDYDVMISYLDQQADPAKDDMALQEELNRNALLFKKKEQEVCLFRHSRNKSAYRDAVASQCSFQLSESNLQLFKIHFVVTKPVLQLFFFLTDLSLDVILSSMSSLCSL